MGRWARALPVVLGVLCASLTAGACGHVDCEYGAGGPGGSGSFVGRLTSMRGASATFTVDSWTVNPGGPIVTAPPAPGASVVVQYTEKEIAFLHVGRRYSVAVYPAGQGNRLSSGVHMADTCSVGTVNADGSSIDTSLWSRSRPAVQRAIAGLLVLLVLTLAFLAFVTRRMRAHHTRVSVGRPPRDG